MPPSTNSEATGREDLGKQVATHKADIVFKLADATESCVQLALCVVLGC